MRMIQQQNTGEKQPVHRRWWFRLLAFTLALVLVFSIWANGAIQLKIRKENEQDAAAQYLIDNTGYVQAGELGRLEDKIQSYGQPTTLEDYYRLAGTQIGAGEYDLALENIDVCLSLYSGEDPVLYMDLLLKKGCLHVLLGQYEQAVTTLEQVLQEDPNQADAYLVLAQIYSEIGDFQSLIPVLREYLELKPGDSDIRVILAQVLFQSGEYTLAIAEYEQLRQSENMANSQDQLLFLEALAYIQLPDYVSAEELLLAISESAEGIAGRAYYLGVCNLSKEDYETGERWFTKSIEAGEMIQLASYSRAVCRLMMESFDYEGAVADLETAIAYSGEDLDPVITEQAQDLLDTISAQNTEG